MNPLAANVNHAAAAHPLSEGFAATTWAHGSCGRTSARAVFVYTLRSWCIPKLARAEYYYYSIYGIVRNCSFFFFPLLGVFVEFGSVERRILSLIYMEYVVVWSKIGNGKHLLGRGSGRCGGVQMLVRCLLMRALPLRRSLRTHSWNERIFTEDQSLCQASNRAPDEFSASIATFERARISETEIDVDFYCNVFIF